MLNSYRFKSGDTIPPSTVTGLTATLFMPEDIQITLNWDDATDNVGVHRYEIWRSTSSASIGFTKLAFEPTASGYIDTTTVPSVEYWYKVRAKDLAGNVGGFSNVANETAGQGQGQ